MAKLSFPVNAQLHLIPLVADPRRRAKLILSDHEQRNP